MCDWRRWKVRGKGQHTEYWNHTDSSSSVSSSSNIWSNTSKVTGSVPPLPKWPRGTVHKDTLHAVFTWPQRPFLVLCVWKLAFKVATRRHLQPHSPQPISGSSSLHTPTPSPPSHWPGSCYLHPWHLQKVSLSVPLFPTFLFSQWNLS